MVESKDQSEEESKISSETHANGEATNQSEDDITPWNVAASTAAGVDYDKLINRFGCRLISTELRARFERLTGRSLHPMIRRGLFFAHRDLEAILDRFEGQQPFYLYTGRGPSSGSLHLGHLVPFMITKWLQDVFKVPLIIQITDDEKYMWRGLKVDEVKKMARENIKDIIALGLDIDKTFIFTDMDYMCTAFYENIVKVWRVVTCNQARAIFGCAGDDPFGKAAFPAVQVVPCFSSSFPHIFGGRTDVPCLVPCGIDQDPYFRLTRDVAPRLRFPKPSLLCSKFLPALQGAAGKMSASDPRSCVYISDTKAQIKNKINRYAFSGGRESVDEHRLRGGDCDVDVSFQFLTYFLEDDIELEKIREAYTTGRMLTGELKKRAIELVAGVVAEIQSRRACITDDTVDQFMAVRPLNYMSSNPQDSSVSR